MNGIRPLKAVHAVLLSLAGQCGNSYMPGACAVAVRSRADWSCQRSTCSDAKPEVDYSRLVPVIRGDGKTVGMHLSCNFVNVYTIYVNVYTNMSADNNTQMQEHF